MPTDTTEKGLESLIVGALTGDQGYVSGDPKDYDQDHGVDLAKLLTFLEATQHDECDQLVLCHRISFTRQMGYAIQVSCGNQQHLYQ
jgi:hypothetical protein